MPPRQRPPNDRRVYCKHPALRRHVRGRIHPHGDGQLHTFLVGISAHVVHPPEEAPWAPGYYSVLFEDPDGIRIEANFVPGKGVRSE